MHSCLSGKPICVVRSLVTASRLHGAPPSLTLQAKPGRQPAQRAAAADRQAAGGRRHLNSSPLAWATAAARSPKARGCFSLHRRPPAGAGRPRRLLQPPRVTARRPRPADRPAVPQRHGQPAGRAAHLAGRLHLAAPPGPQGQPAGGTAAQHRPAGQPGGAVHNRWGGARAAPHSRAAGPPFPPGCWPAAARCPPAATGRLPPCRLVCFPQPSPLPRSPLTRVCRQSAGEPARRNGRLHLAGQAAGQGSASACFRAQHAWATRLHAASAAGTGSTAAGGERSRHRCFGTTKHPHATCRPCLSRPRSTGCGACPPSWAGCPAWRCCAWPAATSARCRRRCATRPGSLG